MRFEHVLVVGAGQMGGGIAQVAAAAGCRVSLHDAVPGATDRALETMRKSLTKLAEKGGADPDETLARVQAVDELVEADLMVEAVVEDLSVKEDIFRRADATLPPEAVLASNTSSIPIGSLAAATSRPDKVIGMHFFNPVPGPQARRGDPRRRDLGRDRRGGRRLRRGARQGSRRRRTTFPASSRTGS